MRSARIHLFLFLAMFAMLVYPQDSIEAQGIDGAKSHTLPLVSPLEMYAIISPAPIVGRDVIWHIELTANGRDLPNVTLYLTLPPEVEIVSGDANWHGDIVDGQTMMIDLTIRVKSAGQWTVDAYAFSDFGTGGFGDGKTLFITSSDEAADVVDASQNPTPTYSNIYTVVEAAENLSNPTCLPAGSLPSGGSVTLTGLFKEI